nr:Extracellular ligand-binding receptor and GPCR domain containing protein [Haemonchus contortus]
MGWGTILLLLYFITNASTVRQVTVPGEIVLGGLFPIHEAGRNGSHCGKIKADQGVQRMVAMLYALEKINQDHTVLPQASLGAQILDTCSVDSYALEQTLEFIKSVMSSGDGAVCADGSSASYHRQPVAAVVGAAGSQVSVMVASMLQLFKIPQVSYSSTGAELSEKPRFAYFSRVVPPDNLQAQVMARVIRELDWTYVHAIADTGSYGERGMDSFRAAATDLGICIDGDVHKIGRRWTDKNFRDLLIHMHRTRKARGVVMFVDEDNLKRLLHTLDKLIKDGHTELDRHFWFVASDSWGIKQSVVLGLEHLLAGSITIAPHVREEKGYITFFRKLSPAGFTFLEEYWEYLGCAKNYELKYFGECFDYINYTLKQESYVPFVIDAVRVLARAISKYISDDCGQKEFHRCDLSTSRFKGDRLQKYYRNVSLSENESPLIDANGDGIGRYDVFQLDTKGVYHKVGKWRSSEDSFEPLFSLLSGLPTWTLSSLPRSNMLLACIPCDTATSIIINVTRCDMCPEGEVPDSTQSYCVPIPPVSMQWDSAWALVPAAFSLFGLASTTFVVGVFLKFSNTPVIMASGRELCYCMISGISMCYILTFFLVSQPSIPTCALTRVLMGLSMSAIYAAIITKTNRLARVFKPDSAQRPRFITPRAQVGICACIVSVQLIGLVVWLLVDPPGTKIVFPSRTEAVLTCKATASHLLVSLLYNLLLIVACTVYAFKTRKIPENFNETRHIGFTMYSTCILWLSFGPIYFATQNNFRIQITSLCMCISLSGTVALVCFFAPKVYIVLFQPYKNVRTRQSAVGRLVNQQMRFMSQLTCNQDGSPNYKPITSTSSNPSYRPGSEENSRGSTQASTIHPLPPLPCVEKLNENNCLPIIKTELGKKLSLPESDQNCPDLVAANDVRRRRPASLYTSMPDVVRPLPISMKLPPGANECDSQVALILEEIATDPHVTFL